MPVYRIFVEKKPEFAVEAGGVLSDVHSSLGIRELESVRLINRYDVEGMAPADFEEVKNTIFSEPQVDDTYGQLPQLGGDERVFAIEYLPGQFDQRADSCAQCIMLSTQKSAPLVRSARVYILKGGISDSQFEQIKSYLINPVESREASLELPATLKADYPIPETVETLQGFISLSEEELEQFVTRYGLAMDADDIKFCQQYFQSEHRDPTITEIRMIDTYWSDHCRHTTFLTHIDKVSVEPAYVKRAYQRYLDCREALYLGRGKNKPQSLMDIATIGAKMLKHQGLIPSLDESEEINACSVKIDVDVDGVVKPYLLQFKNETHNHPTEIEPFGGAATCLGGAIRDPLSGRAYVYQAMRVTGAADPLVPFEETMEGKLPQKKITTTAAAGYSSYGNQIGLATGHVHEIYHPGYAAKRMEIGAVVGAVPAENVVRETPEPSDVVILVGGKTGRDGCGGATGSSKSHTLESLESCGAEVQKGNAPEERKLQRLFRNPDVTHMIKRCNDFGAGGVSVAVGELADGLDIDLNAISKKYDGLDGTELAISESQERMAVVVRSADAQRFIDEAGRENLEAHVVATVTESPRLVMHWNGRTIVDISRDFLNSNGAEKHTDVSVPNPSAPNCSSGKRPLAEQWREMVSDLNICSQKGLVERFDSTNGANTVLMPYGGRYQLTPAQAMAGKIPLIKGETKTCSVMAWGYNPGISVISPYHGASLAVVESIAKVVAAGGSQHKCWLTFQEYFERTQNNPERWGKPFSALLGALDAQLSLGIGAIGGKDSMSGTFEQLDVPPTLVSFAVSVTDTDRVISPEFKAAGNPVYYMAPSYTGEGLPDYESVKALFDRVEQLIASGKVRACWTLTGGGIAEGVTKMALGNRIGFAFDFVPDKLFKPCYGAFLLETDGRLEADGAVRLGETIAEYAIQVGGEQLDMNDLQYRWEEKLQPVFPYLLPTPRIAVPSYSYNSALSTPAPAVKVARPRVLIPVFPGTNCEYDTAKRFNRYGGEADIFVLRNLTAAQIEESVAAMAEKIANSQIIAIPGGFSGGDEPDGSGKFITAFFRNPRIKEAVHRLLKERDGLMLGICNGFQALIKLGLVPYGEIRDMDAGCPTLTFNRIGRHQSMLVRTRIASNKSPWMRYANVGDIHTVAISHGEGRFVADAELISRLAANGQIATQYVDPTGTPTLDVRYNPNASIDAIEGILSPDGRVLGKMGHSERIGDNVYKNVEGDKDQGIFRSAVEYFMD